MKVIPGVVAACVLAVGVAASGCQMWQKIFHPKWTDAEKEIMAFNLQGIQLGSPPKDLKIFSQIKKDPDKKDGMDLYEVFNPNPHISQALFWYYANHLKRAEMRYFNSPGVETLKISGDWKGILDELVKRYGPPSEFGPTAPMVATLPGLDPATAKFNGQWNFTRVNRQLNYIASVNEAAGTGVAVITVMSTAPPTKKELKKEQVFDGQKPPPKATDPGIGF